MRRLSINSRTLLKQKRERLQELSLDDFDYSESRSKLGSVGGLMLDRLHVRSLPRKPFMKQESENSTEEIEKDSNVRS